MVLEWKLPSSVSSQLISMPALLDVYLANVHLMFLLLTDSRLADASPVAASSAQATVIRPSANRARCRIAFPLSWPGSRPPPPEPRSAGYRKSSKIDTEGSRDPLRRPRNRGGSGGRAGRRGGRRCRPL